MAKKTFKSGFDGLLGESSEKLKTEEKKIKAYQETRTTFIMDVEQLNKIKAISFWERKMIKTVLKEAIDLYISSYEEEKGEVQLPK